MAKALWSLVVDVWALGAETVSYYQSANIYSW